MNEGGSVGLSQEEFDQYDKRHEEVLQELYKVVEARDQAQEFLNSRFGLSLRKVLCAQKLQAMKQCANSMQLSIEARAEAKLQYDVICKVESIFGLIIVDGDEALRQLKITTGD